VSGIETVNDNRITDKVTEKNKLLQKKKRKKKKEKKKKKANQQGQVWSNGDKAT